MTTALALKDVCKLLGVQPYRVQHAYAVGAVQEPQTRVSGRRVFGPADVRRLAAHFKVKIAAAEAATEPVGA
jgi:DNA-binding transcriptional MerR regulator